MDIPKTSKPFGNHLLLLITTLLIISSSLNLISYLQGSHMQVSNLLSSSKDDKTTSNPVTYIGGYSVGSKYISQSNIAWPYDTFSYNFENHFYTTWNSSVKDVSAITESTEKNTYFSSDFLCLNLNQLVPDKYLLYRNTSDQERYNRAKLAFFEYLKIPSEEQKSQILDIADICQISEASIFAVSINQVINGERTSLNLLPSTTKSYAGGGSLPDSDRYLLIIPFNPEKESRFITVSPGSNGATGALYGESDIELQNFSYVELGNKKDERNNEMTTSGGAYFGYSRISHVGIINGYLILTAGSGDGCCGTSSIRALNLLTGKIREIYGCVTDINRIVCKNYKGEIYYSQIRDFAL